MHFIFSATMDLMMLAMSFWLYQSAMLIRSRRIETRNEKIKL